MKFFKKIAKHICFALIITFMSIGLGISGVIFPVFKREDENEDKIELAENKDDESS